MSHRSRLVFMGSILSLGAGLWLFATQSGDSHAVEAAPTAQAAPQASVESSTRRDTREVPPAWVLSAPETVAVEASAQNRDACQTQDPGFGAYDGWDRGITQGQLLSPQKPATDELGHVRIVFHFHGHEAARKEWVQVVNDVVLVALDLGNSSSAYTDEFSDPSRFGALLTNVEDVLKRRTGHSVAIGRFGLSAWSAGYGAVRAILSSEYASRVDSVILLDGLHASALESTAGRTELAPFVDFAQRAARGETLMFVSHTSINPPDYASTTQATKYLIWSVGGNPQPIQGTDGLPEALQPYQRFDRAGFHTLGFRGVDKEDHCAQVSLYGHALRTYLLPRWNLTSTR